MAPRIARGGSKDSRAAQPAAVQARRNEPAKKKQTVNVGRPLAVVAPNPPGAAAPREPCNHVKYGIKADLWEWVIQFCDGGEVKVVGQDQRGGPGLIVKKITTTIIKGRIKRDFVVTQSNSTYRLIGKIWLPEMVENNFSQKIIDAFRDGFPENWAALLKDEWKLWQSRKQDSLLPDPLKPPIRGIPVKVPVLKPTPPVIYSPAVEIPSPAWESWEEEEDENGREKDFPRDSYLDASRLPGAVLLPAVPVIATETSTAEPEPEPQEPVASATKRKRHEEDDEVFEEAGKPEASKEKQTETVEEGLEDIAKDALEPEVHEEDVVAKNGSERDNFVTSSDLLTEDESEETLARPDKTVNMEDLEAMLAVQSSAIRAALRQQTRTEKTTGAPNDESGAPSTSASTNQALTSPNYELRRRYDVCYNYDVNESVAKEKQRKTAKGPKPQEKVQKEVSMEKAEEAEGKLESVLAVKKRKSDSEVVAVSEDEMKEKTPTKRQRRHSPVLVSSTPVPSTSSSGTKARQSGYREEKYRVEIEDSLERMTRNQHKEVFSLGKKDSGGRKSTPTKVTFSSSKRQPLSPPARISMSAPAIVKNKFSAQKNKKLRGLLSAEGKPKPRLLSPELSSKIPAKKPRRGTPQYPSSFEILPAPSPVVSPHVRFQLDPLAADEFEEEVEMEVKKPAGRKKAASKKGKVEKAAKVPKNKKTRKVVVEDEEVFPSFAHSSSTRGSSGKQASTSKGRERVSSPEIPEQVSVVKPRVTRSRSVKEATIPPRLMQIPAGQHSVKKTKKGKRRSIEPIRRNAKWFSDTVESLDTVATVSSSEKKKAAAKVLFKNRESTSRKSNKLSLGTVDWEDEDELDFQPKQAAESNKVFRMSMGKATRRPQPRRDTCYDPSNNTDAIRRLNFQGFMENEKTNKGSRGLKRHDNVSDLRRVSSKKAFGMPETLPESHEEDYTDEESEEEEYSTC